MASTRYTIFGVYLLTVLAVLASLCSVTLANLGEDGRPGYLYTGRSRGFRAHVSLPFRRRYGSAQYPASDSYRARLSVGSRSQEPERTVLDAELSNEEQTLLRNHMSSLQWAEVYALARPWTMVSNPNLGFIYNQVLRVNKEGVEGDIMELGVWKGGASMVMLFAEIRSGDAANPRTAWLFDTFQGLPPPTVEDDEKSKQAWSKVVAGTASKQKIRHVEDGKWCYGPKAIVKNNIRSTGYPLTHIRMVEGKVEDSLPVTNLPENIAVLRLDTDWYKSTRIELDLLWDRLSPGGILYVDDYCAWGGARKATDEFFEERGLSHLLNQYKAKKPCLYIVKP